MIAMNPLPLLAKRIGTEAANQVERLLTVPPGGNGSFTPAPQDRCRGAMAGMLFGEALPALLRNGHPGSGPNTQMALIAGRAYLENPPAHPDSFAAALTAANVPGAGQATECARNALRHGALWSHAGTPNSAGAAAAARATVFGLFHAGDPERAAYEAALSATVTHRHGAAIAGSAAVAGAVALAAQSNEPLGRNWLEAVADICDQYPPASVYGQSVAGAIRAASESLDHDPWRTIQTQARSALCTQAIPAALLTVTGAPSPFGLADSGGGDLVLRALNSLHEVSRTIAGACIGARGGRGAIAARGGLLASRHNNLIRTRALADVLELADLIADQPGSSATENRFVGQGSTAVHVSFLIDRSGSMAGLENDVVGGFNNFVAEQRKQPGACNLTLVMFDSQDPFELLLDDVPLGTVPRMAIDQYDPRGATPLLDALGALIEAADERRVRLDHNSRDEDQIVVVFTDGQENCSRRWSRRKLFDLIGNRQKSGWSFVFLGANQDSYSEAASLGIGHGSIQDYRGDHDGVRAAFDSVNRALGDYRNAGLHERERRRQAFFDGQKEAEEDHRGRMA
jgi:uncharacterized protein YegL